MNEYGFSQGIARNASQSAYPNLWRRLVGLWVPGVGVQGQRLVDFARGNNGSLVSAPLWVPGRRRPALSFTAAGYVTMGDIGAVSFERTSSFSIMAWVNTASTGFVPVLTKEGPTPAFTGWDFSLGAVSAGTVSLRLINNVATTNRIYARSTLTVNDSKWHHIACVYTGSSAASGVSFYIDGLLDTAVVAFDTLSASILGTAPVNIGGRNDASPATGLIDDVRAYNRVLSAREIMQSYMGSSPLVRAVQTYGKSVSAAAAAIFRNRTGSRSRLIA